MTWEEYCERGMYFRPPVPFKYLYPDETGNPRGFATTTGKIELASEFLPDFGGQRLPEPAPCLSLCSDELVARAEACGGAHLAMVTGARKQPYNASMYFNNPKFRKSSPHPAVEISPATAQRLGLRAGDTVEVATDKGSARFVLEVRTMRDDMVSVDYGWWHPEWTPGAPDFGGMWESNVNCLTTCSVATGEPMIGTWWYNAIDCVIRKVDATLSWQDDPYMKERTDADKDDAR